MVAASQEKQSNLKSEETPKLQSTEETKKNPVIQSLSLIADYGSDSNEGNYHVTIVFHLMNLCCIDN